MKNKELIQKLKKKVSSNPKWVIEKLLEIAHLVNDTNFEDSIYLQDSFLKEIQEQEKDKTASVEHLTIKKATLKKALLHYVQELQEFEEINIEITHGKLPKPNEKLIVHFYSCPSLMSPPPSYEDTIAISKGYEQYGKILCFEKPTFLPKNIPQSDFINKIWELFPANSTKKVISILHISLHGEVDNENRNYLIFTSNGNIEKIYIEKFVSWFEELKELNVSIECLVLCACHSLPFAEAIKEYVGCIISMNDKFPTEAARAFSEGFYTKIFQNQSFENAFVRGALSKLEELKNPDENGRYPLQIPEIIINKKKLNLSKWKN